MYRHTMDKADWLQLAPSFIASVVTLIVAFGVWKLTSSRDEDKAADRERADRLTRQLDAYHQLYGSLYVWPNAARDIFGDPTHPTAISTYGEATRNVAIDYGRVLMIGSWDMLRHIQVRWVPLTGTDERNSGLPRRSDSATTQ
jgi:hypothetical protein